ncbi:MAG: hypothetical protein RLZZ377_183 [Chloroflexota bacterium]
MATKRTSASKRATTVEVYLVYPKTSSRLLNGLFLKWLLVIPHLIVLSLFAVLVGFAMLFAWVGIWINGRYPRRLWEINASYLRYTTSVNAYLVQLTDEYPAYPANPLATPKKRWG